MNQKADCSGAADVHDPEAGQIAHLLERLQAGEAEALSDLLPLVYSQLRAIARRLRRRDELGSPTLNTTAVVHEAYLKLARNDQRFADRVHFFAVASTAMRQLLVDAARKRGRHKREAGVVPEPLDQRQISIDDQSAFVLELNEALEVLGKESPRLLRVVECRYFGGLSEEETAEALQVSVRTVRRDWTRARAHLAVAFAPQR